MWDFGFTPAGPEADATHLGFRWFRAEGFRGLGFRGLGVLGFRGLGGFGV